MFSFGIIFIYLIWGGFIAIVLYGLYRVLLALLEKYLSAKNDHTAAIREQNQALQEIAAAIRESNDKNGETPEII
ncbi:hypothetical protein [Sphingobacterium paucimobilis]|uniref:Uncharacterized protein n=1 Tax=Sphingobacterium paucimobilis HER1398 TaxID=1346330 RepID=U2HTF7_9SPHI|nr:hypothetical protein [Sphingobacterium paucimobilis]ERJ58797.1 hypothetical protein M472_08450 [Sphingobacterium paucimobilis HER1398]